MIDADQRRGFGHAIALNHCKAEPAPKALGLGIQRRAARNERPKLPAKHPVNLPKSPPAKHDMCPRGCGHLFAKRLELSLCFVARSEERRVGKECRAWAAP